MAVAVADQRQAQLGGEPGSRRASVTARRRGVETLESVPVHERIGRIVDAQNRVLAHSEREGRERMGDDCQAALLVNFGDGRLHAEVALQSSLKEEPEEMAAAGSDLLADDHVDSTPSFARQTLALHGPFGALVVADRDYVQVGVGLDVLQDLGSRSGPIRGERMDMHVRHALSGAVAFAHRFPPESFLAGRSRSGQIWWKQASHWSGASTTTRSNSLASSCIMARLRSRLLPDCGTGTCQSLPR